jgi:hypothetical protein
MMHYALGAPSQLALCNEDAGEAIASVGFSQSGTVAAVLTQHRVHFWAAMQDWVSLSALRLPKCDINGGDIASRLLWHPQGRSLAVATQNRRVLFVEADILINAKSPAAEFDHAANTVKFVSTIDRTCASTETTIDHGIIHTLASTRSVLLVTTSSGHVVCMSWMSGQVLRVLNAATFLTQALPADAPAPCAITFFATSSVLRRSALLLSDGQLVVFTVSGAPQMYSSDEHKFGDVTFTSTRGGCVAAFNGRRHMLAVGGQDISTLQLYDVDDANALAPRLAPRSGQDWTAAWLDNDEARRSAISAMTWCASEDSLCVALLGCGVVVLHHTGTVQFTSFPRFPSAAPRHLLSAGCVAAAWSPSDNAILAATPGSTRFVTVPITHVPASHDEGAALVRFNSHTVSVFQWSSEAGDADARQWETTPVPADYVDANFPLQHACASRDGQHLVCAGRRGCAVFNRRLRRWRLFGNAQHERAFACVAPPRWVHSLVVALPVRPSAPAAPEFPYQLVFYPRFHLDQQAQLASVALPKLPLSTACAVKHAANESVWTLVVLDAAQCVQAFDVEVLCDDLVAPRATAVNVTPAWQAGFAWRLPPPLRRALSVSTQVDARGALLVLTYARELYRVDVATGEGTLVASDVAHYWSVRGNALLVHGCSGGLRMLSTAADGAKIVTAVADFDVEALPIGIHAGLIGTASESRSASHRLPSLPPVYSMRVVPVSYAHSLLLPLFAAPEFDAAAMQASALRLRQQGCLTETFDYLIHAIVHDDPPAGVAPFDRRAVLERVVGVLRSFIEYFDVIVRCVRKADVSMWSLIFAVIGTPHEFFERCVASHQTMHAVHVVRVLMMERPDDVRWSLAQCSLAAKGLLATVLAQRDFATTYDLLRFIALLESEIELPPLAAQPPMSAIQRAIRSVWPGAAVESPNSRDARHRPGPLPGAANAALRLQQHDRPSERARALHRVLCEAEELHALFAEAAAAMLRSGDVCRLCTMFELFGFDLEHFVTRHRALDVDLPAVFARLHAVLGLPRCADGPRPLPAETAALPPNRLRLFTATQQHLVEAKGALAVVASFSEFFALAACTEYVLLFATMLADVAVIERLLHDHPALRAKLVALLAAPGCEGYAPLAAALDQ